MAGPQLNGVSHHSSSTEDLVMLLEVEDGSIHQGHSFGAKKSIVGELVFQTGMVGYPESITDPSYRGQILVMTFPLVGNYGVPSRETQDPFIEELPAHFEASQIHIAGLVVASYSGEDYSHHLASSSLGTWLKEQCVPAMYGVDTRALTKKIREKGSMLGKLIIQPEKAIGGTTNGRVDPADHTQNASVNGVQPRSEAVDWFDPNTTNLVAEGESLRYYNTPYCSALTHDNSLYPRAPPLQPTAT